jgi:hypothetical protein
MKDVEDLLREGMERFTSDLRAPAGMTRRAVRRRRRRLTLRSAAGAATALAAAAVALVVVEVPGATTGGPAVASAAVVKRVDNALSAAEPGDIAQMTVTTRSATAYGPPLTTNAEEWSYGDQWRSVASSPDGHPLYDEGFGPTSVYTLVNYQTQVWARQPGLGRPAAPAFGASSCKPLIVGVPGPAGSTVASPAPSPLSGPAKGRSVPSLFQPGLPGIGFSGSSPPATIARALRTAVSCGSLAVAGRQRVDGIEATELTSGPDSPISETVWVSPGTYLPVRVVARAVPGQPVFRLTANITWLQPTARNQAKLTVPIPSGFREVQLINAVMPILQGFQGKLGPKTLCLATPAGSTCERVSSAYGAGPGPAGQP